MKKSLFIHLSVGIALMFLQRPAFGQTPWNRLELSNSKAKITSSKNLKHSISFKSTLPVSHLEPQNVESGVIQNAVFEPFVFAQLFKRLGGAFQIGSFTSQPGPFVSLPGRYLPMAGIQLDFYPFGRFGIETGVQYFRSEWSGAFPVRVMQQDQPGYRTEQGSVSASASGLVLNLEAVCFLSGKMFQPFLKAGMNAQISTHTESAVVIEALAVPLKTGFANKAVSACAGAGVRANAGKHIFADAGLAYREISGGNYSAVAELAIGWKF